MSLIEVLVAIMLFAIGSLAVLGMTTGSFQTNNYSHSVGEATNLARLTMERIISLPYDDALLRDNTADGTAGLLNKDSSSSDYHPGDAAAVTFVTDFYTGARYQVYWNVANNLPVNGSKTIAVLVVWTHNAVDKQVVFQTIKAQ
jgi:Tfp pilus assembly protein PilV